MDAQTQHREGSDAPDGWGLAELRQSGLPPSLAQEGAQGVSDSAVVGCLNPGGTSRFLLVCEHASCDIPLDYHDLGLCAADRFSHAVWDLGAIEVAAHMGRVLDARVIAGKVSRLVYDLNRPPDDPQAMRTQSERIVVPGNRDLDAAARRTRVETIYNPFCAVVERAMGPATILVTVHSFAPVFNGQSRRVEIGILHDEDARLADAVLDSAGQFTTAEVVRNCPYGPADGVMHTLKRHGLKNARPHVMLEIRNDLIATPAQQAAMARCLADWLTYATEQIKGESSP